MRSVQGLLPKTKWRRTTTLNFSLRTLLNFHHRFPLSRLCLSLSLSSYNQKILKHKFTIRRVINVKWRYIVLLYWGCRVWMKFYDYGYSLFYNTRIVCYTSYHHYPQEIILSDKVCRGKNGWLSNFLIVC